MSELSQENAEQQPVCVGTYLTQRLEQIGIRHLFAVPGDYTSDLLAIVDNESSLERIAACNELNAAYAADGYARYNGIAALMVTSGVGALSALNGVGGSWAEMHPVIVIVGTLSTTHALEESAAGRLFHHQLEMRDTNVGVYRFVTLHQERVVSAEAAPDQIDAAIAAALTARRPVLIEISEDCYRLPCRPPVGVLAPAPRYTPLATLRKLAAKNKQAATVVAALENAIEAIATRWSGAQRPMFWLGHELATFGLQDRAKELLQTTRAPFVTSLLGKSVLGERTAGFLGVHEGVFTAPSTEQYLAQCDLLVALGVWNTDINMLGDESPDVISPADIFAAKDVVMIGEDSYFHVELGDLLSALIARLDARPWAEGATAGTFLIPPDGPPETPVTFDTFFGALDRMLDGNARVVADIGISANGASASLKINKDSAYQIQGIWASIGWSVPAGFGASFTDDQRTYVIVGDGAFKLTCQEISSMVRYGRDIVVFVLNNGVYGVEQMFLDPRPYQKGATAPFEAANVLQRWNYEQLLRGFAGSAADHVRSAVIRTLGELEEVLASVAASPPATWLVDVRLDERDYPSAWNRIVHRGSP
ncbi:thiamine pyrophosphate-binding protein [Sorangium sp. So ce1667]